MPDARCDLRTAWAAVGNQRGDLAFLEWTALRSRSRLGAHGVASNPARRQSTRLDFLQRKKRVWQCALLPARRPAFGAPTRYPNERTCYAALSAPTAGHGPMSVPACVPQSARGFTRSSRDSADGPPRRSFDGGYRGIPAIVRAGSDNYLTIIP